MRKKQYARLRLPRGSGKIAYLELFDHPHRLTPGLVKRTVNVHELIEAYQGPRMTIEFDAMNRAVGIEIIYPMDEEVDSENLRADASKPKTARRRQVGKAG